MSLTYPREPTGAMTSYAQNGEDVVLERVFSDVPDGFYIDVGASDPVEDSVTLHFYERGWRGVNVEPDPDEYARLAAARPRDTNVRAAVGTGNRPVVLHRNGIRGHGTLEAERFPDRPDLPPVQVDQLSLTSLFVDHAPPRGVDFLKVDVEGSEADALASMDWQTLRPRVVVVEAVDPVGTPTHESWEPLLFAASYRFALFDGVNRWYCRAEDADRLLPRMGAPANALDSWTRYRETSLERQLAQLQRELIDERIAHSTTSAELEEARLAYASAQRELAAHAATRKALDQILSSTSWRVTAPLRDLSRLGRMFRRGSSR